MTSNISIKLSRKGIYSLLVFLMIYCSHDTLLFGTSANDIFVTVRKIVPFMLIAFLILFSSKIKIPIRNIPFIVLMVALPLISCIANSESLSNYVYRIALIIAAALFVLADKDMELFQSYNKIIYFLSVWSCIVFFTVNIVPGIINKFPIVSNYAGAQYYTTLFSNVSLRGPYGIIRNQSIFREPGVFVVFLILAIVIEVIIEDKVKTKNIVVYSIATLTTLSTAGFILLAMVYTYVLFKRNFKYKYQSLLLILVAVGFLYFRTDLLSTDSVIFSKFQVGTNTYGSWHARISSIIGNAQIAIRNPLFGVGRYSLYDTILSKQGVYTVVDNTNTLLINYAAFGILYGTMHVFGMWKFCHKYSKKMLATLFTFLIIFVALSNEDLGQNIMYYCLVFIGLFCRRKTP